jgi:hypothetical protein
MPGSRCALSLPGHSVHFIQARHSWEKRRPVVPGRLVAVDGTLVVVRLGGRERRFRNHEPQTLRAAAEEAGGAVGVQEGLSLLSVRRADRWAMFSIADAGVPWRACLREEVEPGPITSLEIARRILDRGGGYWRPDGVA